MVGVVRSILTGDNFIFCWNFWKPLDINFVLKCHKCQICVENENLEKQGVEIHFQIWQNCLSF